MSKMIANRYMLVKHIGQGGMADVYVAVDTVLNREVAIKILRGELCNDPVALLRFQREAVASTTLIHPNIVEIYDVGEDDGNHFIVMEYVRGKTLKQLIQARGAIIKEEAVDIMKQLTEAILEAHKSGIIHRDIKPQNVLVKDDGSIKVVDFGIALAHDALQLTQADAVMGSVHYLAPELARGENASNQSDIYSLGICFYELLTGSVPFKGEQAVQIALKHMQEELPSVRKINPSIPQSVENIILKACQKNRNYRYKTCQNMLDDLKVCLDASHAHDKKYIVQHEEVNNSTKVITKVKDDNEVLKTNNKVQSKTKKKNKANNNFFMIGISSVLLLVSIIAIVAILFMSGVIGNKNNKIVVPDIQYQTIEEAQKMLDKYGLSINTNTIERVMTEDVEKGLIIEVKPSIGSEVSKGSALEIVVSKGMYTEIGNYVGMNIDDACKQLEKYSKLRVIKQSEVSNDVSAGVIIRQELLEPGTKFDSSNSGEIRLVYAAYSTIVIPHSIIGMDVNQAFQILKEQNVDVVLSTLDTSDMSEEELSNLSYGVVISVSPDAGTAYTQTDGKQITLYYY